MRGNRCFLLAVDGDFKYFPSYEELTKFLAEQAQQEQERQGAVLQGHMKDSSAKKKRLRVFADSLSWYVLLFGQTQSLLKLKIKISDFIAELKNIYDEKYQLLRENLKFECEQHNQQSGDKKTVESYIADFTEWAKKKLGKNGALQEVQKMCELFQLINWKGCQPGEPIQFFVFGQAVALIKAVKSLSKEINHITVVGNEKTQNSMLELCVRLGSSKIEGVIARVLVFTWDASYQPAHSVQAVKQQPQAMSLTERCVQARNDTFDIRVGDNGFKRLLHGYLGLVRPSDPWPVLLWDGLFSIALIKPVLGLVKGLVVMPLSLVVCSLEHADASVKQNPRLSTVSKGILRGLIHFALVFVQPLSFLLTFILSPLASLQRLYHDPIDESQKEVQQTEKAGAARCASAIQESSSDNSEFISSPVDEPQKEVQQTEKAGAARCASAIQESSSDNSEFISSPVDEPQKEVQQTEKAGADRCASAIQESSSDNSEFILSPIDESQGGVCQTDKVSADCCASPTKKSSSDNSEFILSPGGGGYPSWVDRALLVPTPGKPKDHKREGSDSSVVGGNRSATFQSVVRVYPDLASQRPWPLDTECGCVIC